MSKLSFKDRFHFASSAFYRIMTQNKCFFSDGKEFCHSDLTVGEAEGMIKALENAVENTVAPMRLLDEAKNLIKDQY